MSWRDRFDLVDIDPGRIEWARVLEDLKSRGISAKEAANHIGQPWTTVQSWKAGSEPRHGSGEALLKFHEAVCGTQLNSLRRQQGAPSYDEKSFAVTALSA